MAEKKTRINDSFGKGYTETDSSGNSEHFTYYKDAFGEGYIGSKGSVRRRDNDGDIFIKGQNDKEGELFHKGLLSEDLYGDKGTTVSKTMFGDGVKISSADGSSKTVYKHSGLFGDTYTDDHGNVMYSDRPKFSAEPSASDGKTGSSSPASNGPSYAEMEKEAEERAERFAEQQRWEHLKNRGERDRFKGTSVPKYELEKYRPAADYTQQQAIEYSKYAAYLLLAKGVRLDADVRLNEKIGTKKTVTRFGPYKLLAKKEEKDAFFAKEEGWALYDAYDNDRNVSDTVDDDELHNVTILTPDGRLMNYSYEDIYYVPVPGKDSFKRTRQELKGMSASAQAVSWDDGISNMMLVDRFLAKNGISMTMDRYLRERPAYDHQFLKRYEEDRDRRKEEQLKTEVKLEGRFNGLHYTALLFLIAAFLTGPVKYLNAILYIMLGAAWFKIDTDPENGIGHELAASAITAFCMLIKFGVNKILFGGRADNETSLIMLGCIIGLMALSALLKTFGLPWKSRASADKAAAVPAEGYDKLVIILLALLAVYRVFGPRLFGWYATSFRFTAAVLLIEIVLIILKADRRFVYATAALYLILNLKFIISYSTIAFALWVIFEPGALVLYTAIANFIVISLPAIIGRIKRN